MLSTEVKESFLSLIRLGIGHSACSQATSVDWNSIKALADQHGLSAVVLDGIDKLNTNLTNGTKLTDTLPLEMKLEWIGEVLQEYEQRYEQYKRAIADLAGWHNANGFKMMVLKGYACGLNWPKPEHRPCGDIDIWLFGQQREADAALGSWFKVLAEASDQGRAHDPNFKIDKGHHHHTVFEWQGFTVENHYDFLNVYHHKSNVEMEAILKDLGKDDSHFVELNDDASTDSVYKVYLPSANLHALFLLRHSMSNFASTGFQLRQLLDWAFFVEKHGEEIDWDWLESQLEHFGMKKQYDVFNAICVEDLGFSVKLFPQVQFQPQLKKRVLNDILTPEFSEKESGGLISRAVFKYRRWKANAWKHELCFNDSLWSAFWSGVWGHLMKPGMI
jgi:hypothetical protein